jgi:60 kDa SS-A/Ro ribonucleoprotein
VSVTCAVSTDSETSIADPKDPGMLDVVGFDTATPQLVSDFARGAL